MEHVDRGWLQSAEAAKPAEAEAERCSADAVLIDNNAAACTTAAEMLGPHQTHVVWLRAAEMLRRALEVGCCRRCREL